MTSSNYCNSPERRIYSPAGSSSVLIITLYFINNCLKLLLFLEIIIMDFVVLCYLSHFLFKIFEKIVFLFHCLDLNNCY